MIFFVILMDLLLISLYVLTIVKHKKLDTTSYDFVTKPSLLVSKLLHFAFVCISIIFLLRTLVFIMDKTMFNAVKIFSLTYTCGFVVLAVLYYNYFTYECIKDDNVYVQRVFKNKIIPIKNIKYIRGIPSIAYAHFYDKENKTIFTCHASIKTCDEFISIIKDINTRDSNYECKTLDLGVFVEFMFINAEGKEKLALIGKECRENYSNIRKKHLFIHLSLTAIVVLAFCGLSLCARTSVFIWIFALPFALIRLCILLAGKNNTALMLTDENLGNIYKFSHNKTIGSQRNMLRLIKNGCVVGLVTCGVFVFFTAGLSEKPKKYKDLITITSEIEYFGMNYYRDQFSIKLKDYDIEYDLRYYNTDNFDFSFTEDAKVGDAVTLLIKESSYTVFIDTYSICSHFYGLQMGDKVYFTYDDYLEGFYNYYHGRDMLYYELAVTASIAIGLGVSYFVFKKKEELTSIAI